MAKSAKSVSKNMFSNKTHQSSIIAIVFTAFLIGFTSITGQILMMRELIIVFYGNELSLGIILASWLFWVAIGSSVLGRIADKIQWRLSVLFGCLFLVFIVLPSSVFAARNIRNILGVYPGELIGFRPILISSFLLLIPLCVMVGFAFALTCRILSDISGRTAISVGQVYISEAVGASIGGLLANFVLIELLNPFQIAFLVGTLSLLCLLSLQASTDESRTALVTTTVLSLALIVAGWTYSTRLHKFSAQMQWQELNLEYTKNSIYGNVVVTKIEEQYSFYENGLLMFTTGDQISAEESVHFAMLEHPAPENVLLIGGGVSGSLREILKHPVEHVDYIELDPLIIEVARKYLSESEQKPLYDSRVQIHLTDARRFIKTNYESMHATRHTPQKGWESRGLRSKGRQHATRNRYDVVIVNLPEPYTALLNRFYSLEFFHEVDEVLADDGIITLSTSSSPNYLNREQREFMRSLYATLKNVFFDVKVLPGGQNYFIAQKFREKSRGEKENSKTGSVLNESDEASPFDQFISLSDQSENEAITYAPSILAKRLKERNIDTEYVREYYLTYRLTPDRVNYIKEVLSKTSEETPINHDFRPIGYFYDMLLWGTQFSPNSLWIKSIRTLAKLKFWHLLVGIAGLFTVFLFIQLKWKRTVQFPVILSIGTTGFSEMLFQVVVILSFQVLYGYVYHKLSLILAAFMIGLVGGSWFINRTMDKLKNPFRTYILTQISICIYPLILVSILLMAKTNIILHLATPFALLPIIAGFIGGVQFPLANKICLEYNYRDTNSEESEQDNKEIDKSSGRIEGWKNSVGRLSGLIYGIDLFGSCMGAILASIVFVPILGVFQTCFIVALLNTTVLILIIIST